MSSTSVLGGIVRRKEDPALVRGAGAYTDDIQLTGMTHAAFVRSPFAHARVNSVDTSAAEAMDGVLAVYTAADVADLGALIAQVPVGAARPLLNGGTVKHVGEAVAMVVAEDRYTAQDAADAVEVDWDPLDAVIDLKDALSDSTMVHDGMESNTLISWVGPFGAEEDAIAELRGGINAAKDRDDTVVVSQEMLNQRLIPVAIEPAVGDRRLPRGLRALHGLFVDAGAIGAGWSDRPLLQHERCRCDGQGDRGRGWLRLQAERVQRRGPGGVRLQGSRACG